MTSDQLMSATVRFVAGAAPLSKAWKAPVLAASAVPSWEECGLGARRGLTRGWGPADHSGLGQEAALPGGLGFEAAPPAYACPCWEAAPPMRGSPPQRGAAPPEGVRPLQPDREAAPHQGGGFGAAPQTHPLPRTSAQTCVRLCGYPPCGKKKNQS